MGFAKRFLIGLAWALMTVGHLAAQFSLSGQFKPRLEFRNGYRVLARDDAKPAAFVSQRSRLIFEFRKSNLETKFSVQDVRVWGDEPQLSNLSNAAVHEAWAQLGIADYWAIRLGRQELVYDDHRLLGNVEWLQQARSHDALVVLHQKEGFTTHLGLAYNNEQETLFRGDYTLANYRALGFLWLKKTYDSGLALSFTSVTDGLEDEEGSLHYRSTLGPHVQYNVGQYSLTTTFYYQLGETVGNLDISAFLFSLNNTFKFDKSNIGVGLDYVSGTDGLDPSNDKVRSFHTLYATNHKFYGFMDYFLNIPVDTKGGGLIDVFAKMNSSTGSKSFFDAHLHYFLLANRVQDPGDPNNSLDSGLGLELDLVYSLNIQPEVQLKLGWSSMLPTDAMRSLRGGDKGNYNTWLWSMLVFKPQFFKTKTN